MYWGSLQKIKKSKIEKGSPFLAQLSRLGASVITTLSIGKSQYKL